MECNCEACEPVEAWMDAEELAAYHADMRAAALADDLNWHQLRAERDAGLVGDEDDSKPENEPEYIQEVPF